MEQIPLFPSGLQGVPIYFKPSDSPEGIVDEPVVILNRHDLFRVQICSVLAVVRYRCDFRFEIRDPPRNIDLAFHALEYFSWRPAIMREQRAESLL